MAADTLIGIFLETVATHRKPDQFMRKTPQGWESIAAERALADVESVALALRERGVEKGDRVALLSENRYEWPVVDLAVQGLGAVLVPIYPTLTPHQVRHIVANAEVKVAVASSAAQLAKLSEAVAGLAHVRQLIVLDPGAEREDVPTLAAVTARGAVLRGQSPQAFRDAAREVRPDDLATIIYTSGTTGEPKGAMLTHDNIVFDVQACLEVIDLRSSDRCLSFLPLCHIFERMAGLYAMLTRGVSIAYAESLDTVSPNAVEVHPTILCGVPRFYEKAYARVMENVRGQRPLQRIIFHWGLKAGTELARHRFARRRPSPWLALQAAIANRLVGAKVRARLGGRVRMCISGGAPLSPKVMEFFFAMGLPVHEGYGLTETSPVITLSPPGREKPGSVGPPIPGVEVKIGNEGEILTRGRHVMRGYYRNEEATRAALADGWFRTGDIGHLDDENFLFITDRLKDLLVTAGGKKVAPQPIEARLKLSKWVSEAVLIGDNRPFVSALLAPNFASLEAEAKLRGWTFHPVADLVQRAEVRSIYQSVIDVVNADLAQFEKIKQFALLDHELSQESGELTPTLKVKRRVVNEKYAPIIERLYGAGAEP
jgi:long-chain acyl-CoA synthetase